MLKKTMTIVISFVMMGIAFSGAAAVAQQQMATPMRVEGSITMLDLKAQPAVLKLTDEQGNLVTLSFDPKSTKVLKEGGRQAKAEELQVGQKVRVESISKEDGAQQAKTIEVINASATPSSATSAMEPSTAGAKAPSSAGERRAY